MFSFAFYLIALYYMYFQMKLNRVESEYFFMFLTMQHIGFCSEFYRILPLNTNQKRNVLWFVNVCGCIMNRHVA